MKPHKQETYIKAWAEGHEIEWKTPSIGWTSVGQYPYWYENTEYRIKPAEKVVRWLWIFEDNGIWSVTNSYLTESEFLCLVKFRCPYRKLEWSREEFDE